MNNCCICGDEANFHISKLDVFWCGWDGCAGKILEANADSCNLDEVTRERVKLNSKPILR